MEALGARDAVQEPCHPGRGARLAGHREEPLALTAQPENPAASDGLFEERVASASGRIGAGHQDQVGASERGRELPQPTGGQRAILEIASVDAHDVEVAREAQMLEPVVEDVDAWAEARLDGPAHDVAPRAHRHDDAREGTREHEGLVTGERGIGRDRASIAHDQRLAAKSTPVSSAQD